jgi:hypothetical protein
MVADDLLFALIEIGAAVGLFQLLHDWLTCAQSKRLEQWPERRTTS